MGREAARRSRQRTGGDGDEQCVGAERPAESYWIVVTARRTARSRREQACRDLEHGRRGFRQNRPVSDKTCQQLQVIKAVTTALGTAGIRAWLFGGWGLDARIGHITREHGDVEFWIERVDAERSKAVLVTAGANALETQPPTESCEFTWRGTAFSTAYFDRQPEGAFEPAGRALVRLAVSARLLHR